MLIFLYGPDAYSRNAKKRFYISEFLKKNPARAMEAACLSETEGVTALALAATTPSLFDVSRLVVLEDSTEIEAKKLSSLLAPFFGNKNLHALFSEDKKPEKPLQKLMEKPSVVKEFEILKGTPWIKFIKEEAALRNISLAPDAVALLAQSFEGSSYAVAMELDKLACLKKTLITAEDLKGFGIEVPRAAWPLLQGLRGPRAAGRLFALESLLLAGEPDAKIFNIVSALSSDASAFAEYDLAIKTGLLDYEEALTDFAIRA